MLLARTRISIFLLSVCFDKVLSTPKITTLLPHSSIDNENCERASNPLPKPLHLYLLGSAFLVNLRALNRQSPSVKSVSKSHDHVFNSLATYKFTPFL